MSTPPPQTPLTPYLKAAATGGFIGFMILSVVFWNVWFVLAACGVFFGLAVLDVFIYEIRKARRG